MSEPCTSTHRIEQLEKRDDIIFSALKKMEDKFDAKLDMILFQINKVAVLEANHEHQSTGLNRAFQKIEALEETDRELTAFKNTTEGMAKMAWILWGAIGAGLFATALKAFFG